MASSEYWLVTVPNRGDAVEVSLNKFARATGAFRAEAPANPHRVDVPNLVVGTLDSLMSLRCVSHGMDDSSGVILGGEGWMWGVKSGGRHEEGRVMEGFMGRPKGGSPSLLPSLPPAFLLLLVFLVFLFLKRFLITQSAVMTL